MLKRTLHSDIDSLALSRNKMAFISGPRQVGKTTLAKMFLNKGKGLYGNWDDLDFRRLWTKSLHEVTKKSNPHDVLIFDEIHKAHNWKRNLKGFYDSQEKELKIIVTGSARLNIYKKGSDSLMGRYINFRLHPFSLGEMLSNKAKSPEEVQELLDKGLSLPSSKKLQDAWSDLENYGGFPEPLMSSSQKILNIWQRGRVEKIVREDLRDISRIVELSKIEMLISLLPERVASPLSITSLRELLEVDYKSVQRWLNYLKELYYHFEIKPWSKNISRGLKKESKLYLWDWSEVKDKGARFENMVASHLLKACHYWTDVGEGTFELFYVRTKEKKEIDFLITKDRAPWLPVECKLNKTNISPYFFKAFDEVKNFYQLVNKKDQLQKRTENGKNIIVCTASKFLRHFP